MKEKAKKFLGFFASPWTWWLLIFGLAAIGLIFFLPSIKRGLEKVGNLLGNFYGNPDQPQILVPYNPNQLDASINSIVPEAGTQSPTDRTRSDELLGLFHGEYGDRSWSDLTTNPGGFLAFVVTGNSKYLLN